MTPVDTELPKDARALKALALAQRATILDQQATLLEQQATLELLRARSRELEAKALKFQDLYFGRSSEKTRSTATAEDFKQIPLFQAELLAEAQRAAEANNVSGSMSSAPGKPRRKGGRRSKFPSHLPHVETKYELKDDDKVCDCGCEMHVIGFETSKELERIETTIVHTIKRAKYGCRDCGASIKTAPGPFPPVRRRAARYRIHCDHARRAIRPSHAVQSPWSRSTAAKASSSRAARSNGLRPGPRSGWRRSSISFARRSSTRGSSSWTTPR